MKTIMIQDDEDPLSPTPAFLEFLKTLDPLTVLYITNPKYNQAKFYYAQNPHLDPSSIKNNLLDLISFTNVQLLTSDQHQSLLDL
jgi:hypothetical protein